MSILNSSLSHTAVVVASLTFICGLNAELKEGMTGIENRLRFLESQGENCIITPSAGYAPPCDFGAFITIDPLYLRAQENGLAFVTTTKNNGQLIFDNTPLANLSGRSRLKSLHFGFDWGFRLGAGLALPYDGWDLGATWMRFYSEKSRHIKAKPDTLLTPTFLNGQIASSGMFPPFYETPGSLSQGFVESAHSIWNLHLNAVDLEMGRKFFVSPWLSLRPHFGLRSAWIHQKDKLFYKNFLPNPAADSRLHLLTSTLHCNYWGMGLLGGVDTQWGMFCGWSLYANIEASLLYGYFQISSHEQVDGAIAQPFPSPAIPYTRDLFHLHDFYHLNRLITDLSLGLRYDYLFCDERYHLGFQAGWEMHSYFGQNQFFKFIATSLFPAETAVNQGDLTLQGFAAQVAFDF